MRIIHNKVDISYDKTQEFYDHRASKYNEEHPYISIMCQDAHPEIAEERNRIETAKILPKLELTHKSRVLDLGCGIGRWADVIPENIAYYLGCDFSKDLIAIAEMRNKKANFSFHVGSAVEIGHYCKENKILPFTNIIISGMMIYLNDSDVEKMFSSLDAITQKHAIVYVREAMGISDRLTLKDFYSEELQHNYNTIYRTRNEYREIFETYAPQFKIQDHGPMFDNAALNNRKETAQFYFILRKNLGMK